MRIIPASLLCVLFVYAFSAQVADAQGTVHTVFGSRAANTTDDLQKSITRYPYTWEIPDGKSSVTFKSDGTGKQTFFNFTWRAKNAQEIELTMAGSTSKAEIRFSDDYTSFTGTDFDGSRAIHGSISAPQAPAAPPPLVASTPHPSATPSSSNSFFDTLITQPASSNDALEKAIVNSTFTWEPEGDSNKTVTFQPGGVGQNTFFKITWRIKSPHEVEIAIPGEKEKGKITLHFNSDFTKYTATDFDGVSSLKGHKITSK